MGVWEAVVSVISIAVGYSTLLFYMNSRKEQTEEISVIALSHEDNANYVAQLDGLREADWYDDACWWLRDSYDWKKVFIVTENSERLKPFASVLAECLEHMGFIPIISERHYVNTENSLDGALDACIRKDASDLNLTLYDKLNRFGGKALLLVDRSSVHHEVRLNRIYMLVLKADDQSLSYSGKRAPNVVAVSEFRRNSFDDDMDILRMLEIIKELFQGLQEVK